MIRKFERPDISIHAPHTRSDDNPHPSLIAAIFQSTPLIRGATCVAVGIFIGMKISIHAPHTRSDVSVTTQDSEVVEISIHAPHTRSDTTLFE